MDSDLEAFSHYPADGSFAALTFQPVNWLVWESNAPDYFKKLSTGLQKFSKSNHESQKARSYAAEVSKYLQNNAVIQKCNSYYRLKVAEAEAKREAAIATLDGETTGAILSQAGAKKNWEREPLIK
jgi:hypothetical protein